MGEYIERDAAIQALGDEPEIWYEHDPVEIQEQNDWDYYKHCIEAVPVADVAPVRHGRWIDAESDDGCTVWHCSKCSYPIKTICGYPIYKYCPMCGALMDRKEDNHEAD